MYALPSRRGNTSDAIGKMEFYTFLLGFGLGRSLILRPKNSSFEKNSGSSSDSDDELLKLLLADLMIALLFSLG